MQYDRDIKPEGVSVPNVIQYANGVFNIAPGIYKVEVKVGVRYKDSTEAPGTLALEIDGNELGYTVSQLDSTLSFEQYK